MSGNSADAETTGQEAEDADVVTPADLVEWVEQIVSRMESIDLASGQHWCSQWWNHTEAVDRFRALHERWLNAQADGEMSSWWVDHFDRHAVVLFGRRGPFGECGTGHQDKAARQILACEGPEADWTW